MRSARVTPIVLILALGSACEAGFTDLRPPREDLGFVDPLLDQGNSDQGRSDQGRTDQGRADLGGDAPDVAPDTAPDVTPDVAPDATPDERLVSRGTFENLEYQTFGSAEVWMLADGSYELRFSNDFATTDEIPGPAVALSVNPDIAPELVAAEGDVDLGALRRASGPQSYALPFAPGPREYAWVWCQPFGIEVARARLEAP